MSYRKLTPEIKSEFVRKLKNGTMDTLAGSLSTAGILYLAYCMHIEKSIIFVSSAMVVGGSTPLMIEYLRSSVKLWYMKKVLFGKLNIKNDLSDMLDKYPVGSHARIVGNNEEYVTLIYRHSYHAGCIDKMSSSSNSERTLFLKNNEFVDVEILNIEPAKESNRPIKELSIKVRWTDTYPLERKVINLAGILPTHLCNDEEWNCSRGKRLSKIVGI